MDFVAPLLKVAGVVVAVVVVLLLLVLAAWFVLRKVLRVGAGAGAPCRTSWACLDGACASDKTCCPSAATVAHGGVGLPTWLRAALGPLGWLAVPDTLCADLPPGAGCAGGDQCASGLCASGRCWTPLAAGATCELDDECASKTCASQVQIGGRVSRAVCCPSQKTVFYQGGVGLPTFGCAGLAADAPCAVGAQCLSGACGADGGGTCD